MQNKILIIYFNMNRFMDIINQAIKGCAKQILQSISIRVLIN